MMPNPQYAEAAADPKGWAPEPGMIIRPFHKRYVGMPELFHVYCERHPDFGVCGTDAEARESALQHGGSASHLPAPTQEGRQ